MITELIDNEFIVEDNLHPLQRLGFKMIKNNESRAWTGKSNMYIELKTFEKKDEKLGEWCLNIEARKGGSGYITFNRINGYLKLLKELSQNKRSIKSNNKFCLFRKQKNKIDEYYSIHPPIHSNELQNLLFDINQCNVNIKVEGELMNFEFNFDSFIDENYEQVVKILSLIVSPPPLDS